MKAKDEYSLPVTTGPAPELPAYIKKIEGTAPLAIEYIKEAKPAPSAKEAEPSKTEPAVSHFESTVQNVVSELPDYNNEAALVKAKAAEDKFIPPNILVRRQAPQQPKPRWHAPWKLMRVSACLC